MSVSVAKAGGPSFQPYECSVCQSRFTRHENLKRHSALHSRTQNEGLLSCDFCDVTFSRSDLRHRHMKKKHPEHGQKRATKRSRRQLSSPSPGADLSGQSDTALSVSPPEGSHLQRLEEHAEPGLNNEIWNTLLQYDQRQVDHGTQHQFPEAMDVSMNIPAQAGADNINIATGRLSQRPMGRESISIAGSLESSSGMGPSLLLGTSFMKTPEIFDSQLHPLGINQPASFDSSLESPIFTHDIQLGLPLEGLPSFQSDWHPSLPQVTKGCSLFFRHVSPFIPFLHQPTFSPTRTARHLVLGMLCLGFQYGEDPDHESQPDSGLNLSKRCFQRALQLVAFEEDSAGDAIDGTTMTQTYLLLQIYAMMYLCGKESALGLKMHSKMISTARSGGLMKPISTPPAAAEDLESLWRGFVKAESHKRTLFAVHQIDALWYQFLSIPRSISHLEIKHELPCVADYWTASSSTEWAHRQLVSKHSGSSMQYVDAVRQFLSPSADLRSLPAFDPYGAINITQFLISSAREISGWSTMTGMLSVERFEPLRLSLAALDPFIRPEAASEAVVSTALSEATWETAMIELQLWSPSHTSGIVGGSMDAVLNQSAFEAPPCEFLCEPDTAKSIQPHVDWFLRYLDTTVSPDSEAPWVAVYAYKAFLIALQLVRGGVVGAMQVVGVADCDVKGALTWATTVFRRRHRWQLGKLILSCLDTLEV